MKWNRKQLVAYGLSALAVLMLAALLALIVPTWVIPGDDLSANQRLERESELRGTLLQAVAGLVVAVGAMFAAWNVILNREATRLAERGQVTERFTKAVEQLADQRIAIRLGGIYALRRLAADSSDDATTVTEVLSAFVRANADAREPDGGGVDALGDDLLAALSVLAVNRENTEARPDLCEIDLSGRDLSNFDLAHFDLGRANLRSSTLIGADLEGADLSLADLRGADLSGASLALANLREADLTDANLTQASLDGATMGKARMAGTRLGRTDLSRIEDLMPDIGLSLHDNSTIWPEGFKPYRAPP
ncbi:MAG TPA: pentapeptide repeat-containing protein [Solirubrobacterales bacterium]|nr:pentapeptide repeat-containing protein [Solirubrobacterales bacterium]